MVVPVSIVNRTLALALLVPKEPDTFTVPPGRTVVGLTVKLPKSAAFEASGTTAKPNKATIEAIFLSIISPLSINLINTNFPYF